MASSVGTLDDADMDAEGAGAAFPGPQAGPRAPGEGPEDGADDLDDDDLDDGDLDDGDLDDGDGDGDGGGLRRATPAHRAAVYGARDFGYTYVKVAGEEPEEGAAGTADGGGAATNGGAARAPGSAKEPTVWMFTDDERGEQDYIPFQNVSYPRDDPDLDPQLSGVMGACACCCTLSFATLIAGAFLQAEGDMRDMSGSEIAGTVLLAVGIFVFCMAFLLCCLAIGVCCHKGPPVGSQKSNTKRWSFKRLNDRFNPEMDAYDSLRYYVGDRSKTFREKAKKERAKNQARRKDVQSKEDEAVEADLESGLTTSAVQNRRRPTIFKIVFDGDIYVSTIDILRDQISMCLVMGSRHDTVCIVVTSGGGAVTMYGLAAAQLARVRKRGMRLIVCVDSIAASGGYMMATMADEIHASPFALVGSIGVISIVPNVQKLLEKHDISTHVFTAGKYKRTVDVVGEVTEEAKQKMSEELEEIHQVFKDHIVANRPALSETIDDVATGEAWLAIEGKKKGLVDVLETSDEYFLARAPSHDIIEIKDRPVKKFPENLMDSAAKASATLWDKLTARTAVPEPPSALAV